jgi:hypothetical protein
MTMNALQKDKAKAPIRPTGRQPSAQEMLERATKRWPKTIARLPE